MKTKILSARPWKRIREAHLYARLTATALLGTCGVLAMALTAPLFAATANPAGPVAEMPPFDDRLGKSDGSEWSDLSGPTFLFNSGTPVTSPFGVCGGCYAWSSTYYKSPTDFDVTARRFTVPVSSTATAFRIWWAYGNDAPKPNNANKGGVAADFSSISLDLYSDVAGVPGALIANLAGTWSVLDAGTNYREYKLTTPYTFTSGSYFVSIRAVTAKPNYDATLVWMMCAPSDPLIDYIDYTNANNGATGGWFAYTGLSPCPADQNFGLQVLSSDIITPGPVAGCITDATCMTVPVNIARTTSDPMRGFSVSFTLSAELDLCIDESSITEGTYLNSIGGTNFQVVPLGGDSYTVDCAILGLPCGATAASGTLFDIAVKKSGADGTGTVTIDSVLARDCANAPIAATPGAALSITIDTAAPSAIALTATQDKSGNGSDGRTFIDIVVPPVAGGDVVRVYRKGFGNYPEYDDSPGPGSVPSVPATEAAALLAGWALTGVTATGADEPPTRDFWYYVAFVEDPCGNVSGATSIAGGRLNYHLGDTHNGATDCAGDNLVDGLDIGFLGANYGITLIASDPKGCLDVGPTTDFSVDARPTTDNRVQFEDLIMFAINYGQVSKTNAKPAPASMDELRIEAPSRVVEGETTVAVDLVARGTGRIQGLSTRLSWDGSVVEPIAVYPGEFLLAQGGVAFSPEPGVVDAAALGAGSGGISGEGVLATVSFRVIGPGAAQIRVAALDARDAANRPVELAASFTPPESEGAARVTAILPNVPNPFNPSTMIAFRLAEAGDVALSIFTADGRRVRTLAQGRRTAGLHEIVWDGRDSHGADVSSGIYYTRLETAGGAMSRPLTLLR